MDQNKQEQQHGDAVMCFYWLSDPEEEEAFYKLLEWTSHSHVLVIINMEEIDTGAWLDSIWLPGKQLNRKGSAVLVNCKLTVSHLSCRKYDQQYTELHQEKFCQQVEGSHPSPLLRSTEKYLECWVQFLSPQYKRQRDTWKYWSTSNKMGHEEDQDLGASVIWESERSRPNHPRQEKAQGNPTNVFI